MAKLTLQNLSSLQNEQSAINIINNNNDAIEAAVEKTLSRDGTVPNQMTSEFDMNFNRILNLPQPVSDSEPLRLAELNEFINGTGDGNVIGPVSSVGGNYPVFSGTSGKILADSGTSPSTKANVVSPTISDPTLTGVTSVSGRLAVTQTNNNEAIRIVNNSASTPNKYIRVFSDGDLEVVNSAGNSQILQLSDTGALTVPSSMTASSFLGNGTSLTGVETSAHAAATYSTITRQYNTQTGTSYTLALSDSGRVVLTTNNSAVTITIPPNSSVAFPILTQIDFLQFGTGKLTLAQGSGVTISSNLSMKSIAGQYQTATILKIATDAWVMFGSLSA